MEIRDFLNYVTYPNDEQRTNILTTYFDTQRLQLDIEPFLKLNGLANKISVNFFDADSLFDTVNKDLREYVRRYNNDVFYITDAVFRMVNYYNLMNNSSDSDELVIYEVLYRRAARCVCSEIYMYEEKIKNLIRTIFHFDKSKTKKYDKFSKELRIKAKNNLRAKAFIKAYKKYRQNYYVQFVKNVRNDEIHNDSVIDKYTDKETIVTGVISLCGVHYALSNESLNRNIQESLNQLETLKNGLQLILDNHQI